MLGDAGHGLAQSSRFGNHGAPSTPTVSATSSRSHRLSCAGSACSSRAYRVLFDSWYMRRRLLLPLIKRNIQILGQVRRDTALFLPPPPHTNTRGRPRKYGCALDSRGDHRLANRRAHLVSLRQGATGTAALYHSPRALPQGCTGTRRVVRMVRPTHPKLDNTALAPGQPNSTEHRVCRAHRCQALGDRAAVSQSQALVGRGQPLATDRPSSASLDAGALTGLWSNRVLHMRKLWHLSRLTNRTVSTTTVSSSRSAGMAKPAIRVLAHLGCAEDILDRTFSP